MADGDLLATSDNVSDIPPISNWEDFSTFNFSNKPFLTAGQKYVIEVLNATPYVVHSSNPYPGGHADDTTNPGNTGKDLKFQTYMEEANKVTYQPEANFEGSDSFNFSITNDGTETNATTFITVGDPQDENSTESEDDNSTDFIPIYELNSTHLYALTAVQGSAYESNYSIVEELNASNQLEIRFHPMVQSDGNWFPLSDNLYYYKNNSIQSMQDVEAYLQSQNLQPINLTSETDSQEDHNGTDSGDGNSTESTDDNESLPIYFFTTEDIEWFTDYEGEQEGNYAIWFYDPDTIDLEPVEQDESGNWRLTANEFDYLEFAYVYADIPQILEDINDSTLIGHVAPDDEEGNSSMPIYLLSTQQIESLTDFPDQTAGNFMIWDMGGWIDLEPAELTDGSWELTDDPSDHIEVNSSQYPSLQSIIEFLGDQHPVGQYHLDQNDSDGDPVDEDASSPDDSFTSPDDSFESPDDDFQSPDDSFTSPDDSFESPDDDFHSPDDSFTSPDDSFESPDDDFQSPDDSFTSPDDSFESPDDDFHSPDDSFTSPDDSFESPDDDFHSPDDSFTSPDRLVYLPRRLVHLSGRLVRIT